MAQETRRQRRDQREAGRARPAQRSRSARTGTPCAPATAAGLEATGAASREPRERGRFVRESWTPS